MKDFEILNLEQLVYVKGGGPKGESGLCSKCRHTEIVCRCHDGVDAV